MTSRATRNAHILVRREVTRSPTLLGCQPTAENHSNHAYYSAYNPLGTHFNFKIHTHFLKAPQEISGEEKDRTLEVGKFFLYKVIKLLKVHSVLLQIQTCL